MVSLYLGLSVLTPLPAASELAVAERYQDGAIDAKVINLYSRTQITLEADGKAYTGTRDVIAYLVENASRLVKRGTYLIDVIHEDKLDPNFALLLSRNDEELKAKCAGLVSEFLSGPFYDPKIAADSGLLAITEAHYDTIAAFVNQDLLNYLPASGFIGGEEPGEDVFHLGAWMARIVLTLGVQTSEEAAQAIEKSYGKPLPEKVAYWRAWVSKPSWKKVYAEGLH
ncbi:hypothetical protein Moror_8597 [Moniliophthora roreri MCA 2997]|uniref:Uncharacterized protein n=1 Tax=Moniliophthora roreri (strain MCA 2997) TaxID=1381753 RepID=V2X7E6_MONRO|nr:hypothetical protein Moror_8597 [Moniliophthora roreri MCA 2997]